MKITTNLTDAKKLQDTIKKTERLCKLYKCNPIDLIVMSIDTHAENKKANKLN